MNFLVAKGINKTEDEISILKNINFTQQAFEKLAVAGATGSGKTSLLKIIAGLITPTEGEVLFEGTRVKGPEEKLIAGHPQIAYLSQQFELLSHYRVEEIAEMKNLLSKTDAETIYQVCRIDHLLKRWTHQLSGGEKQRIALARLLIAAPKLLLLDEPYSNLDVIHKNILKNVIKDIGEQLKITCILVSHDPVDVLSWADTILVLKDGRLIQRGTPAEVYYQPVNEYTAGLFGKFNVAHNSVFPNISTSYRFIRPELLSISFNGNGVQGTVINITFMGSYYEYKIDVQGFQFLAYTQNNFCKEGDTVFVSVNA